MRVSICDLTLSIVASLALLSLRRSSFCFTNSFLRWSRLCKNGKQVNEDKA